MEEQKDNKEIKMNVAKEENNKEQQKYTYEQLNDIANKLFNENRFLKQQLHQATETIKMFNRLDYLLKVVEIYNSSKETLLTFDTPFIHNCLREIEQAMTIPEQEKQPETPNK